MDAKKIIMEALAAQKETFGDDLYTRGIKRDMPLKQTGAVQSPDYSSNLSNRETEAMGEIGEFQQATSLEELDAMINTCLECPLGKTRNKFVFGAGNPNADVMCVGEGPGADEDREGEPFVGRAGKLLTDILKAINFSREEVFIANVVKCRPPGNRTPLQSEMDKCLPYLKKQIELIKPKVILCLGTTAAKGLGLMKSTDALRSVRGMEFDLLNTKAMVTYHPAALLRNPNWKRGCWEDVQKFRKLYDSLK